MRCASVSNYILCKIESGEDVMGKINEVLKTYSIQSGSILWAIGMMENVELGYLKDKEYKKDKISDRMEVVSFHGTIAMDDPRIHAHVALADEQHAVKGGHFFGGTANPLLEIEIQKFDGITLKRKLNESSGLKELHIP